MLTTIHEAVFVETGKVDKEGNKIKKHEAVFITVCKWRVLISVISS